MIIHKRKILLVLVFLIFITAFILFLCFRPISQSSVNQKRNTQYLSQPFSASASIHMGEVSAVADINRTAADQFTFCFQQPSSLNGLTLAYSANMVGISYHGMSVNTSQDSLLAKGIGAVIMKTLDAAASQKGINIEHEDGFLSLNGTSEYGQFCVKLEEETGALLEISIPEMDLECCFSNVNQSKS
jgi:hypothetical protein